MTTNDDQNDRSLSPDAFRIWKAGLTAVAADRLVADAVSAEADGLTICGERWQAQQLSRICVVGGGKAGTGMALGLERALGVEWLRRTSGWLNVPADCVRPTQTIHLHPARPPGVNEPTAEGQAGAERILQAVAQLGAADLCLVLLSGGGSALLPAPADGITLADKQAVTRFLMRSGATIAELNSVRRQLSRIKGGGLLRTCRAGRLMSLIISDVIGDPLDVIASGPTVPSSASLDEALGVLRKFDPRGEHVPASVLELLKHRRTSERNCRTGQMNSDAPASIALGASSLPEASNFVIGNNRTAVEAAAREAARLGYVVVQAEADRAGIAREVGRELAEWSLHRRHALSPGQRICRISGGEPTVKLREWDGVHEQKGGRNQELVLAAAEVLWNDSAQGIAILSAGTDGEDGPTDAAGATVDEQVIARARRLSLDPQSFLEWNNSYAFFAAAGGHLKTGPTLTNVMDLRVVLVVGGRQGA